MWLFPATHMPPHPLPRDGDWQLEKAVLYRNFEIVVRAPPAKQVVPNPS
jgi:hypothetical protein